MKIEYRKEETEKIGEREERMNSTIAKGID